MGSCQCTDSRTSWIPRVGSPQSHPTPTTKSTLAREGVSLATQRTDSLLKVSSPSELPLSRWAGMEKVGRV